MGIYTKWDDLLNTNRIIQQKILIFEHKSVLLQSFWETFVFYSYF